VTKLKAKCGLFEPDTLWPCWTKAFATDRMGAFAFVYNKVCLMTKYHCEKCSILYFVFTRLYYITTLNTNCAFVGYLL